MDISLTLGKLYMEKFLQQKSQSGYQSWSYTISKYVFFTPKSKLDVLQDDTFILKHTHK